MSQDADWPVNPTVRLWQLTETLRQLRERSGLTLEETAEKLSAMGGRWSRVEALPDREPRAGREGLRR
jgi:hypothetical protein